MSRTYRRKTTNNPVYKSHFHYVREYHSEEEFAIDYNKYKNGIAKPTSPKRPKYRLFEIMFKDSDFYKRMELEWEEYRRNYYTPEYFEYVKCVRFQQDNYGKDSLEKVKQYEEARYHSDSGYGRLWMCRGPKWYVKMVLQRPFRRAQKQAIHHAIRNNADFDECDVVIDPFIKTSGYYW